MFVFRFFKNQFSFRAFFLLQVLATLFLTFAPAVSAQDLATTPEYVAPPAPVEPPRAQAYVVVKPGAIVSYGNTMVPLQFLATGLGASVGKLNDFYRIAYFGHVIDVYPHQQSARFDDQNVELPIAPQNFNKEFYIPWTPIAKQLGVKWSQVKPQNPVAGQTKMLLQYSAAYIEDVHSSVSRETVRIVMTLSNPTRVVAAQGKLDARFALAAARRDGIPSVQTIHDYLIKRTVLTSGNWQADFAVRINYAAPVQWFTLGSPSRLVIDVQRLFEDQDSSPIGGGLKLTSIRRGIGDGPVQMYVARVDPRDGWRIKVAPGGYSVLQRKRPSRIAQQNKALLAVNGGFFAYDGAAVGAVLSNGEWIRLPWGGRTAVGFRKDGSARIDTLQAQARVVLGNGETIRVRELNGWPDKGRVTVLTSRFGKYYKLKPGEMALEVSKNVIVSRPGGGGVNIPADGFTVVASGGGRPPLERAMRGTSAQLKVDLTGWNGIVSALGGGPRLVDNGQVSVTDENFRSDVRVGRGPRTAFGIDKQGRYIICVVDGRQPSHSIGLTLTELAYTMQKLGAVDAMNLDGGGSTALAVRSRVVNRPSDGSERAVSNALLVMR